jgi:uncharacterized protein (DUF427 family)
MKATWNGEIVADSDDTVVVEGNHYFPVSALRNVFFTPSDKKTTCHWKGEASYYDVTVNGKVNKDAAWFYPTPTAEAAEITGRVAFWRGVQITP